MQIVWKHMSGGGVGYSNEPLALTSLVSVKYIKGMCSIIRAIVSLLEVCYIGHLMQLKLLIYLKDIFT